MLKKILTTIAFGLTLTSPAYATCTSASYYGPGFHGGVTASGERFNQWAMTAAHPHYRLGTKLRVCNGGNCVVVRVNDRGPYVASRGLDLSLGAFSQLMGGTDRGVANVCYTKLN